MAGINPKTTLAARQMARQNAKTVTSSVTASSRGNHAGVSATSGLSDTQVTNAPTIPAASDNTTLSIISCRTRLARLWPSAHRSASSRCRPTARVRISAARFAHEMRSTSPTAVCSSVSGCRMFPKSASSIGWSASVHFPRSGNICSYAVVMARVSAAACSSDTPGVNRPMARSQCALPWAAAGSNPNAIQASDAPSKRSNEGGVTPMIVVLFPSRSAV